MTVTEEEYKRALEVVKAYEDSKRVFLRKFYIDNMGDMSGRLKRCLNQYIYGLNYDKIIVTYLDELTPRMFFRTRNTGRKTWIEFSKLKNNKL